MSVEQRAGLRSAHLEQALLVAASVGLAVGGIAWWTGARAAADAAWFATTLLGIIPAVGSVVSAARQRRLGADVIALGALVGALAVGEVLAGAIITLMLASGRAIEARAAARARTRPRCPRRAGPSDGATSRWRQPQRSRRRRDHPWGSAVGEARRGARRRRSCGGWGGGARRVCADRRVEAGRTSCGRRGSQRRGQRRGAVPDASDIGCCRFDVCRDRAAGGAVRSVLRTVRPDGRSLQRSVHRGRRSRGGPRVGAVGRSRSSGCGPGGGDTVPTDPGGSDRRGCGPVAVQRDSE